MLALAPKSEPYDAAASVLSRTGQSLLRRPLFVPTGSRAHVTAKGVERSHLTLVAASLKTCVGSCGGILAPATTVSECAKLEAH